MGKKINKEEELFFISEMQPGQHLAVTVFPDGGGASKGSGAGRAIDPLEAYEKPQTISKDKKKWASWGKDNKLPLHIMDLVLNNNMAPGNLDTKDQIALGDRLVFYYDRFENNKFIPTVFEDIELYDWLEELEIEKFREEAMTDFHYFSNFWAQLQGGDGSLKNKIVKIKHTEAIDCRAEVMDPIKKKVLNYGISDWSDKNAAVQVLPVYDPDKFEGGNAIMHLKKRTPGNPYYALPVYIGAQSWLRHANKIPIWKTSNMDNSLNVKYHIEIPETYFLKLYPEPKYSAADRYKKYQEKVAEMAKFLSGAENVGKAFFTQIAIDPVTKAALPGWKINAIENNINHEAYSTDFQDSNNAILSSMAMDPNLSGVSTNGKMGSGSEKRESYIFHSKVLTRYARRLTLEPAIAALKNWGYDKRKVDGQTRKIKIGVQDIELTTTDVNPNGVQRSFQDEPTGQSKPE